MQYSPLTAISPVDGRYASKCADLNEFFSEFALNKYRTLVEVQWLIALSNEDKIKELPAFSKESKTSLRDIAHNFSIDDAQHVKDIEKTTNHDVKAVEYFIKEKCNSSELKHAQEFIHFACTSEDINNLAYALMIKHGREVMINHIQEIIDTLNHFAQSQKSQAMLARTHGQSATPTTLGKEFKVFAVRLTRELETYRNISLMGKINGATGNFNAHHIAYPEVDWLKFSEEFISSLGLTPNLHTTQIESHDFIAQLCDSQARFNTILIDFNRDVWGYISLNYLKQKLKAGEVGSSTMPHKVNPIDFENSEGNCGVANALANHFSQKLPISRWQRDLTDSTVLRNIGMVFAYSKIAYSSLLKGLSKIDVNPEVINQDLNQHWEVLTEAIQTMMRKHGHDAPYEQLKALSRGNTITESDLKRFIEDLDLPDDDKQRLLNLTPENYIGLAEAIIE